jgi:hypothetical protein
MNPNDKSEEILANFEKEEKEFRNHWVWKELNCSPEDFFKAIKKHVENLKLSPAEWERALSKAKLASRIRAIEHRQTYPQLNTYLSNTIKI